MQYLLSEEEYKALKDAPELVRVQQRDMLQKLCTMVANHMPVERGGGAEELWKPWGCVLTHHRWYCDKCPVIKECPNPGKEWSD